MKSNTSVLRIAKNLGSVGLLFSITKESGVMATETSVDSQIKAMSSSVQQALSQSGSEALADSEIENMIQSHVQTLVEEQAKTEQKAVSNNIFLNILFSITSLTAIRLIKKVMAGQN